MRNYRIYIPTKNRVDAQFTWDNIPDELKSITFIVCPASEAPLHRDKMRNIIERPEGKLSFVRQWLLMNSYFVDCVIMLDDDLSFFKRKSPDAPNLRPVTPEEAVEMFDELASHICTGEFLHGGISPRQGNNWLFPEKIVYNTRMNAVHAVNPTKVVASGMSYADVDMMEDYHMTLGLFAKGFPNFQLAEYAWDQNRGSGAPGGFSGFRTPETQKNAAEKLHSLHPKYVKVVTKAPKTGTGDFAGERTDVRISWKKAAKEGGANV